ncbi:MAG TPA: hypothetical protein PLW34_02740 [Termitinemataceae bacterium]|nr:hypothetical protein [Termitinemataceae bacterium]HOM22831.1 hypothetical protein [Termitinemataceae bacterium]HPP99772.1 hypothetical protein [Termitinemataceae bacterium]
MMGGVLYAEEPAPRPVILEISPSAPLVNQEVCFTFFVDFPDPSGVEVLFPPLPPQLVLDRIIRDVQRSRPEMGFTESRISRIRFYFIPRQVIQEKIGPYTIRIQGKEYTVAPVFLSVLDTPDVAGVTRQGEGLPPLSWELPSTGFRVGSATEVRLALVERGDSLKGKLQDWTSQISLHPDWIVEQTAIPSPEGPSETAGGKVSFEVLRLTLTPLREGVLTLPEVVLRTGQGVVLKSPVQEVRVGSALPGGNRRGLVTERPAARESPAKSRELTSARATSQKKGDSPHQVLKEGEALASLFEGVPSFLTALLAPSVETQVLPLWENGEYGKALGAVRRLERDSPAGFLYRGPRRTLEETLGLPSGPDEYPLFWVYFFVLLIFIGIGGWLWWNLGYKPYQTHKRPFSLGVVTFFLLILFFVVWYGGTSFFPRIIYGGRPAIIGEETSLYQLPYFTEDEAKQSRKGTPVKVGERVLVQVLSSPWCYVVLPHQETGWIQREKLYFY